METTRFTTKRCGCGLFTSIEAPFNFGMPKKVTCRGCGRAARAYPVYGSVAAHIKCDARCQHATGFTCDCSCGGKNHGKAHG